MALLQSSLVEPLLSRQQSAVIREIARAAQLNEALMALQKTGMALKTHVTNSNVATVNAADVAGPIEEYLKAEITRVLMQIKIPATASGSKADTNVPNVVTK